MTFNTYGEIGKRSVLLIPGLGISYEIFLPLIGLLKDDFFIVAVGVDGFLLGQKSEFTFVAKPQAEHLLSLCPDAHIAVFPKMNHGQLLIDHPDEVARRIFRNFAT